AHDHQQDRHPVGGGGKAGQGSIRGGEAGGGDRGHGVVQRVEPAHASPVVGQGAAQGEQQIHADDVLGHHVGARQHLFRPVGGFGLEQAHATDAQQRQDRHRHGDEADAAQPLQQRPPQQQSRGGVIQVGEHRAAGGGDARHAFEEGIRVAEVADHQHGQGGEQGHHQPAGGGQQIHVAGTQVLLGGPAGQYQGQAAGTGDQARPEKGLQLVGASVPQLGEQRQKHAGGQ